MKKKIAVLTLCATLFALYLPAEAQQPKKIPRIGYLSGRSDSTPGPSADALRQGLRDLGYIEGKDILIEYRYSEGKDNRFPSLLAELVQLKVDVLVSPVQSAIHAAQQATKTIPIVMMTTEDPVATGLVDSLARPGRNITGLTRLTRELAGKRLELLKEVVFGMSRVGILLSGDATTASSSLKHYEAAARILMESQALEVRDPNPDFAGLFRSAAKSRVSALVAVTTPQLLRYQKHIADLAIKNRLPSMHEQIDFVETGGLMSYATDDAANFRRAAYFVDKILKGAKPAEIPVEQPTKFEFVINLKTAKALNLTIPQSVLYRADKVIK